MGTRIVRRRTVLDGFQQNAIDGTMRMNACSMVLPLSLWSALVLAAPPSDGPMNQSTAPNQWVQGGAISTLHGPTGFVQDSERRGPSLRVQRISVRVELYADMVLTEQTYTIENPGAVTRTTVGMIQSNPRFGHDQGIQSFRPVEPVAYLDNVRLPDEDVHEESTRTDQPDTSNGYQIGIRANFPPGTSLLSLITVVQTSPNQEEASVQSETEQPWSRFSLQCHYYSWGWTPEDSVAKPTMITSLRIMDDVNVMQVHADEWTEGAVGDPRHVWWRHAPWFVLRYQRDQDAAEKPSVDVLRSRMRELLDAPPLGHLTVPDGLTPVTRPGQRKVLPPTDPSRVRRAMIIPIIAFLLVLLALYLYLYRRPRGSQHQ
jgi:hypothetical protein